MSDAKIYDILIIGGGITGAAIAHDAALRGLSAILIEKGDFCSGTSSRSTKMLHGGLRYLEQFDFGLVRESLKEREILKRLAPHQIRVIPFLLPIYKNDRIGKLKLHLGMRLYDWLRPGEKIGSYRVLGREKITEKVTCIRQTGLLGGGWYDEYLLESPERFVLSMIQSAGQYGAEVRNYLRIVDFLRDGGRVCGVNAVETQTDAKVAIRAKIIVNAAGPWVDEIVHKANPGASPKVRATKGIHFFVPKISDYAVIFAARRDGRLIFGIPWKQYTNIGSTDTDYESSLDEVYANKDEIEYLLAELKNVLNHPSIDRSQIIITYAGIRPLVFQGMKNESQVSRRHVLFEGEEEGGIISVVGGKLTTARLMAEQIVDMVCKRLGKKVSCATDEKSLVCADFPKDIPFEEYRAHAIKTKSERYKMQEETVEHLFTLYGTGFETVLRLSEQMPGGKDQVCGHAPDIYAQVQYAVMHEMAKTLLDVVFRRTEIGLGPALKTGECEKIVNTMAKHLNWNETKKKMELESYFIDRANREQW